MSVIVHTAPVLAIIMMSAATRRQLHAHENGCCIGHCSHSATGYNHTTTTMTQRIRHPLWGVFVQQLSDDCCLVLRNDVYFSSSKSKWACEAQPTTTKTHNLVQKRGHSVSARSLVDQGVSSDACGELISRFWATAQG